MRLLAVGDRQPAWVNQAFASYTSRFPPEWRFTLDVVAAAPRRSNDKSHRARAIESEQVIAKITRDERVIVLDERGVQMSSPKLAGRLADWQAGGKDLCLVIGGPDGLADDCRERADGLWSLSSLTLPHGLARVLLAEQLYRAWSLLNGHPYHRT